MDRQIRAAGYVRVSSKEQVDGESLTTQRASITSYAKAKGYVLTEIYADEGISGGTVRDRHALQRCLQVGQDGGFNILIIHRLSRFGRNARELLDNANKLKEVGIDICSVSEGIDFSTKYGKAMLGMLAVIAELERDIIREQLLENRIARGRRGVPTSGSLPYGRTYNRETGEWTVDAEAVRKITWAADEYLKGEKATRIARRLDMSSWNLTHTLRHSCDDVWTITFKGEAPIRYQVPPLLPKETVVRLQERLEFNKRNNRRDVKNQYLLSGFIRCERCKRPLRSQTQRRNNWVGKYYVHVRHADSDCMAFTSIICAGVDNAVLQTIFENVGDAPSFERAIASSLPDTDMVGELKQRIQDTRRELNKVQAELAKLVDLALSGTLAKDTIRSKETELLDRQRSITETLDKDTKQFNSLPDIDEVKREADAVRQKLLGKFGGVERLHEMSFEEKRELLHWLFDGRDGAGTPYGIYVTKRGKRRNQRLDYFLYGRITGLRTLKGDNINYMGDVDEELRKEAEQNNYITKKVPFIRP